MDKEKETWRDKGVVGQRVFDTLTREQKDMFFENIEMAVQCALEEQRGEIRGEISHQFGNFDGSDYSNTESVAEIVQDAVDNFSTDLLALPCLQTKEK